MKDGRVYDRKVDVIRDTLDEVTKVEFDLLMQTEVSMRPSIYVYKRVVIPTIQSSWKTSIIFSHPSKADPPTPWCLTTIMVSLKKEILLMNILEGEKSY